MFLYSVVFDETRSRTLGKISHCTRCRSNNVIQQLWCVHQQCVRGWWVRDLTPSQFTSTALLPFPMQPYSSMSEGGTEQSSCWKMDAKSTFLWRPTITRRAKTAAMSYTVFPLIFTRRFGTCIVVRVFFIWWWKPPGIEDAKLVIMSCLISTASCTLTSDSDFTSPFTMLYSESDWRVGGCECLRNSVNIRSISSRSSSRLSLPSSLCFTVVAADACPALELYISIAIARWEHTPIDSIQTAICSRLVDMPFSPSSHVGLRIFKLLLGKCTQTRWNYCCRKYWDWHLSQDYILKNRNVMAIVRFISSYIWRPCWFRFAAGDGSISLQKVSYLRSLLLKMWV